MSKKVIFPLVAVFSLGVAAGSLGCHAEARIGNTTPKAATPPPPPEPPPPPAPPPPPVMAAAKPIKALGKAKIEKDEIKIPGKIHFDTDKATLKDDKETKEILQTVADVLKENPHITKLRVEGHTDDQGGKEHNQKLSQERADAVIGWLTSKGGIDKSRLDGKGWGEEHYLVKNDTPANREQNRRVEFKLWELEGKATDAQKNDGAAKTEGTATTTSTADPKAVTGAAAKATDKKDATTTSTVPATTPKK